MVRVYLAKILLPEGAARKKAHELQSEAAHRLLILALEKEYPEYGGTFQIEKDERGKPFLRGHEKIHISLSHSGELAACAAAEEPVGVDVEQRKQRSGSQRILRRLHEREREWLLGLPEDRREQAFYDLWVRKESFLKATGEGLGLPLSSFSTVEEGAAEGAWAEGTAEYGAVVPIAQNVRKETYYIRQYESGDPEYSLAACSRECEFAPAPVWLSAGNEF